MADGEERDFCMTVDKKGKRIIILTGLAVLVVMAAIFAFSSFNGNDSGAQSGFFSNLFAETFVKGFDGLSATQKAETVAKISRFVRKAAHFTEFAALGAAVFVHVSLTDRAKKGALRVWRAALIALPFSVLYAASDEVHQLFVAGRAGAFTDVLIDSAGVLSGILLAVLAFRVFKKRK